MIEYSYDPPYNHWSGNRSDTLNKWKINYKGSIATASALPEKGDFKGDTYNVLEDGSNYMWNGKSWDKLDANVYVGSTATANGIRGLVPPATTAQMYSLLTGMGTWQSAEDLGLALDDDVVHKTDYEEITGLKTIVDTNLHMRHTNPAIVMQSTYIDTNNLGTTSSTSGIDFRPVGTTTATFSIKAGWNKPTNETSDDGANFIYFAIKKPNTTTTRTIYFSEGQASTSYPSLYPNPTNTTGLGSIGHIWKDIFAGNTTIQTSDERLKESISSIPEDLLDLWGEVDFVQYQFKDSVLEKGKDKARYHTGLIAQHLGKIFENKNLDASKYGFYCYDEWDEQPEILDDNGNVEFPGHSAGDGYALRYGEALCIEAAYQRRRAERAEARIKALEDRLEALEAKLA